MNKTHESYMNRMKANNKMNITRVMHMTMQERKKSTTANGAQKPMETS